MHLSFWHALYQRPDAWVVLNAPRALVRNIGGVFLGSGTAGSFGWKLGEVCSGGPSARKARWTLSVAGDTMIASIARGFKAGKPFTLKRCATR
ncbi:hypothetical protein ACLBYG_27170 [Methylobacterium sp. D53M]